MAAATLTSPVGTPTGTHSATLTVTSNQATGTIYAVITGVVTTPSHAQIVAGQDNTGAAAIWAGSGAGATSFSKAATKFRSTARLYVHFTQVNAGAEASTPVSVAAADGMFWLDDVYSGTFNANGTGSVVTVAGNPYLSVSGTFGSGTVTFQYLTDHSGWVAIKSAAFTTADQLVPAFARSVRVRAVMTGSTTPSCVWSIR